MIEFLRAAAEANEPRPALVLNDREVTHAELVRSAEEYAAGLTERGIERFAIVTEDASVALGLVAGASLAGVEACIYPSLETPAHAQDLAERFDHTVLVHDGAAPAGDFELIAVDELAVPGGKGPEELPERRPHMMLTTGTTGVPRGVRHDWWRLTRAYRFTKFAPQQRWILAYDLHQYSCMHLLLYHAASGSTLVAPEPRTPRDALAAMREHDVEFASGTPTFWRFVLAEMSSDGGPKPALVQITLAGEVVPDRVLNDIKATFPEARTAQIYGANESGSLRGVADNKPGLPASVLDADDDADLQMKIVDGELWVRSRIGMLGYYGDPPIDPDDWRATGDLVEVVGDRILFRGRDSEVFKVGGEKVHPQPVEERIGALEGVSAVRVFGRPNKLTGNIVAAEVIAADGVDTDELDGAIREACEDLPAASRPRSIKFVETIDTTGTKIKRRAEVS